MMRDSKDCFGLYSTLVVGKLAYIQGKMNEKLQFNVIKYLQNIAAKSVMGWKFTFQLHNDSKHASFVFVVRLT